MPFEPTLPPGAPDLLRASAFLRSLAEALPEAEGPPETLSGRLSSLSPSLLADLQRFDRARGRGAGPDPLEVLAAALRHGRRLLVHLRQGERVLPLTVFPPARLVHAPVPLAELLRADLTQLEVLHVEPALLQPPGHAEAELVAPADEHAPLAVLAWELALRGPRAALLPEIAGPAAYRVSPAFDRRELGPLAPALDLALRRLQRETTNLRAIAAWPGFDRSRAIRVLNGLYLQAALIVTHAHPAATSEA